MDGFTRLKITIHLCSNHSRKREQQMIKYLTQGTTWPLGQDVHGAFLCLCMDCICSQCWRCVPNQPFQAVIRTWWMSQPVKWFVKYMLTLFTGISAASQTFTGNEAWLVLGLLRKVMRHKEAGQQGWIYRSDTALLILRDTLRRRWERDSCRGSVEGQMRGK